MSWAWNAIQAAVNSEDRTTADIWEAVNAEADAQQRQIVGGRYGVGELRSLAVQQRNAGEALNAAEREADFDRSFAPQDINSRSLGDQALLPELLVRFEMTVLNPAGETEVMVRSARMTWTPGLSVGDVTDAVWESAGGLADEYQVELVDVGNLRAVSI